jgi:hypothetical protein
MFGKATIGTGMGRKPLGLIPLPDIPLPNLSGNELFCRIALRSADSAP